MEEIAQDQINNDLLGDSIAWSGCTIMYLLGQQLHFELFDFSYQFLNVAEVETAVVMQTASSEKTKNLHYLQVPVHIMIFCLLKNVNLNFP